MANTPAVSVVRDVPNGAGMAAILAAAIGCATLGVLAFLGDAFNRIGQFLNFYNPTGTLSGVTDTAIIMWLCCWYVLAKRWGGKDVAAGRISLIAFMLLAAGVALTFPPFMDLLQGK